MLVQLGSHPPPSDVVDLLMECHGRIRRFCGLALRLSGDAPMSSEEVQQAAHYTGLYFSEALALHASDENMVLLPRLKGVSDDIDAALTLMSQDHLEQVPMVEGLVFLCRRLEQEPGLRADLRGDLFPVATDLGDHFERHLSLEEDTIFPAARVFLSTEQLVEMMGEVRARRR